VNTKRGSEGRRVYGGRCRRSHYKSSHRRHGCGVDRGTEGSRPSGWIPGTPVTAAKLCGFIVDRMNAFKQTIAACGAAAAAASGIGAAAATPTRQPHQQQQVETMAKDWLATLAAPTAPLAIVQAKIFPCCCYTFS